MKNGSETNRPTQNQFRWSVGHLLIAFESAFLPIPTRFCLALIKTFRVKMNFKVSCPLIVSVPQFLNFVSEYSLSASIQKDQILSDELKILICT